MSIRFYLPCNIQKKVDKQLKVQIYFAKILFLNVFKNASFNDLLMHILKQTEKGF